MTYSKAKLKSSGDKASPCFRLFLIGYLSDKCLPTRTLLHVSFRHIVVSITNFRGMPNSVRILLKTSLVTEYAFLKSTSSWWTALEYFQFFSSIWRMQDIWSVVDLLRRNPHWWSPVISSAYEVNLYRRMFDIILYAVDKSDKPR